VTAAAALASASAAAWAAAAPVVVGRAVAVAAAWAVAAREEAAALGVAERAVGETRQRRRMQRDASWPPIVQTGEAGVAGATCGARFLSANIE